MTGNNCTELLCVRQGCTLTVNCHKGTPSEKSNSDVLFRQFSKLNLTKFSFLYNLKIITMKKITVVLFILGMTFNLFSQPYDTHYSIEYALKKADGTLISLMTMVRDGDKMKFTKINNRGKDDENKVDVYVFKNEGKVYTINTYRTFKMGTRHALDMSYVGMLTGVYLFELGNDGTIFNSNSLSGNTSVLGNDCTVYILATQGDAKSEYDMYQDNLMLRRFVGSPTEGNVLEATTFNKDAVISPSEFVIPADVQISDM